MCLVVMAGACSSGGDEVTVSTGGRGVGGGQGAEPVTPSTVAAPPSSQAEPADPADPADPTAGAVEPGLQAGADWVEVEGPGFTYSVPPDWTGSNAVASGMWDGDLIQLAIAPAGPVAASVVVDALVGSFGDSQFALEQVPIRLANGTAMRIRVTYDAAMTGYTYVIDIDGETFTMSVAPVDGGHDPAITDAIAASVQPSGS